MADEPEKTGQGPNLELPSLRFFGSNRKKRRGEAPQDEPDTERTASVKPVAEPAAAAPEDSDPLAADPFAPPRGGIAPSTDKAKRLPPVPPPTARTDAPAQQIPVLPPPPPPAPQAAPEQTTVLPITDPGSHPEPVPSPARAHHETEPDVRINVQVDESLDWPVKEPADDADEQRRAPAGTSLKLPVMSPRAAVVVTGALVGLLGVLLAYFASRGCETVRGVGSCGGMGLLALLLIVAVEVVLGAILLKACRLSDPTSTSFLGVGLMAVFVLLFLLSSLESVWMLLVIPALSALTFLLSWWVTTAFVEVPGDDAHR